LLQDEDVMWYDNSIPSPTKIPTTWYDDCYTTPRYDYSLRTL
jgi:hypothetical protein